MNPKSGPTQKRLLQALGAVLIAAGFLVGWLRASHGPDYAVMHAMAVGVVERTNVYSLNAPGAVGEGVVGMVYPPAIGFIVLPLAFLPFEAGRVVWFLTMNLTLVLGIRALARAVAPPARQQFWPLSAGIVLFAAATRWGMMLLQGAPFVLGLLCFFLAAQHQGRRALALALAIVAVGFKMTLSLPFLGLLLVERQLVAAVVAGASWVVLNVLGFLCMGAGSLATYRANTASFEAINAFNINGPDPWMGITLPRLDWVYLFYGVTRQLTVSRVANLALAAATAGFLLRAGLRVRPPLDTRARALFCAALVCLGLLCVYHHQYDACCFFAPVLLAGFGAPELFNSRAVRLSLPFLLVILVLPIGQVQGVIETIFGSQWVALLKMSFPVVISLGLVGALIELDRKSVHVGRRADSVRTM